MSQAIQEVSPWTEFKFELMAGVLASPVDLYIKLSEEKYIKIYRKEDLCLQEVVEKYSKRGVKSFYCRAHVSELLSTFLLNNDIIVDKNEKVMLVQNLAQSLGVSDIIVNQINQLTDRNIQSIDSCPNLSTMLKNMLGKGNYLSQHSTMVAFISCVIAKKFHWSTGMTLAKLSFAGVLHDMTLTSDILLKLKGNNYDKECLDWKEQKKYINHIEDVLLLLHDAKKIPADVSDIISGHHDFSLNPNSPNKKSESAISQINAIFILADEFCHQIHDIDGLHLAEFKLNWKTFHDTYDKGNFKKPLEALNEILFGAKAKN